MKPILLVVAPYYQAISEMLVSGATDAIYAAGRTAEMITVPGALEIPAAIALAARSDRYAAYVALGCVIRGETTHYEIVSNESARALMELATHQHLPIGNGILTCETMEQAVARATVAQGNKGGEAAVAALRMLAIAHTFGLDLS
ncbi:MAG: 6,7-dimethyl-8-ribityllumazine synthase [Alphaproteobacteria bacterium]|nr:6,7-dimethyl-8-ribityllumazine synthase [Alphaproteobacteria bacterium]